MRLGGTNATEIMIQEISADDPPMCDFCGQKIYANPIYFRTTKGKLWCACERGERAGAMFRGRGGDPSCIHDRLRAYIVADGALDMGTKRLSLALYCVRCNARFKFLGVEETLDCKTSDGKQVLSITVVESLDE
jgi:hypothetical protein